MAYEPKTLEELIEMYKGNVIKYQHNRELTDHIKKRYVA
jgi:ATPase subunit of ABC transporter with duplicated ATPase domains